MADTVIDVVLDPPTGPKRAPTGKPREPLSRFFLKLVAFACAGVLVLGLFTTPRAANQSPRPDHLTQGDLFLPAAAVCLVVALAGLAASARDR